MSLIYCQVKPASPGSDLDRTCVHQKGELLFKLIFNLLFLHKLQREVKAGKSWEENSDSF